MSDVTLQELQDNFKKLNFIGKAVVTAMLIWRELSDKKCRLDQETKDALMINHLKLLELATEYETLGTIRNISKEHGTDAVDPYCNKRLDNLLNELKLIQNNIDILGSHNDHVHH